MILLKVKISYCAESFVYPYTKRPDLFTVNEQKFVSPFGHF